MGDDHCRSICSAAGVSSDRKKYELYIVSLWYGTSGYLTCLYLLRSTLVQRTSHQSSSNAVELNL